MITLRRFQTLEADLRASGLGHIIDWSERVSEALDPDDFAARAIYVICNSGMRATVAGPIYERCLAALNKGCSASEVFAHPLKAPAINRIWGERELLFAGYCAAIAKLDFLAALPGIGPVTKHHLAKNLGHDTAKPDVHLMRLAARDRTKVATLCRRLARATGYRVATIDTILWRACADGILSSRTYELEGWAAAYHGTKRGY